METIIIKNITDENGKKVAHLTTNYTISKIALTLESGDFDKVVDADIHYAQNRVTTDLIWFATACGKANSVLEFVPNSPASVSDLYITLSDENVSVKEIELYIAKDVDLSRCYPVYTDYDLGKNYYLDTITVFTKGEGYSEYSLFTSINGKDFDLVARKTSEKTCPEEGESYCLNGKEARIVRLFTEYNSASCEVCESEIKYTGKESGREMVFSSEPYVETFEESIYNCEITDNDTICEVYSIIERNLGSKYTEWFSFEIDSFYEYDYFDISSKKDKIHIKANNGVSLAVGLNYYLKYFLKVNISQTAIQNKMPEKPVFPKDKIHRETKAKYRYAYNYCTLSYSMSFWDEKKWRKELDWLALNGVNLVLDLTAQEEVWRRFLKEIGYSHNEIKKFIAGPGYYAWAYMSNLYGFGGPVYDNWFEKQTELARKNHLIMRKLGMKPILQGYSGMVPCDIKKYDENISVIPQGTWCSFQRPDMLETTSPCFMEYAKKFYKAQREVYGDVSNFFAADPFHEGGITLDMKPCEIAENVLSAMISEVSDAVWVVQSWQNNPTSELLRGIEKVGKNHAVILDLYAEKQPNYNKGCASNSSFGYEEEFNHTPWIYCMLNNFGGRLGLHGHLDNIERDIPRLFNKCKSIAGIGITPEASFNNPVLYEYLFEAVWVEDCDFGNNVGDMKSWIYEYSLRRYASYSHNIIKAWEILLSTVYKSSLNMLGQGAPESILNARPALSVNAASTWGNSVISYDKNELSNALLLFLKEYDNLKDTEGYRYDVISLALQVLSNKLQDLHKQMSEAFFNKNLKEFCQKSDQFIKIAEITDDTASQSEHYLFGKWINDALNLSKGCDDFTRMRYLMNAKALVTTWGAYNQSETGGLHDYSNRQWGGLTKDFYIARWKKWIEDRKKELDGKKVDKTDWFKWEWAWVREDKTYPDSPREFNLKDIGIYMAENK